MSVPPYEPPQGQVYNQGPQDPPPYTGYPPAGNPPPDYNTPSDGYPPGGYPPAGGGYSAPPPPQNYLVWSILTTLFCCLPLGIASIVFSAQVNSKWALGDFAGAQDSSNKAKQFAMWGAIGGAVVIVLYIVFVVIIGVGASIY